MSLHQVFGCARKQACDGSEVWAGKEDFLSETFQRLVEQARLRLPLPRLMEQHGDAPANGKWKTFPTCPICQHATSAGVKEHNGRHWFKCFNSSCSSGTQHDRGAWDEIGYLAHKLGLNRREGAIAYLKEAGVWQERDRTAPSVMPGQQARR